MVTVEANRAITGLSNQRKADVTDVPYAGDRVTRDLAVGISADREAYTRRVSVIAALADVHFTIEDVVAKGT